jgi:hypothetical protein
VFALAAGLPVAVLLLAGCGGGGSSTSGNAAAATPAPSAAASSRAAGRTGGRGPAASGEIAAVTGKTLQVQNASAQTAVTWSAATAFTKSVPATLAVGDCVTATGTPGSGSAMTATSVRVLATSGCTFTRNGGPGGANGTPRPRPSGGFGGRRGGGAAPSGAPGAPGAQSFATAFGKVTAVSGSSVTVSGRLLSGGRFGGSPRATPAPSATPTPESVTVTLGSSAAVVRTVRASGADAKVGACAVATGKADSTGAVAATAIALSAKGANGCTGGFGGRFGGFGGIGG